MTAVYIVLGILGVLLYILGGVVWFFLDHNESPLWLLILTTIFWPVVLVLGVVLILLGYILIFLYNLFTGR